jgi:CubicO group peptidase (beta-lactamase class C family)
MNQLRSWFGISRMCNTLRRGVTITKETLLPETGSDSDSRTVGRRGFLGAGLATTAAALLAPAGAIADSAERSADAAATHATATDVAAPDVAATDAVATHGAATDAAGQGTKPALDATTLVRVPASRVPAAVAKLDGILESARSQTGVPGVAAAVVYRGRLVYAKGFGVRDVNTAGRVNAQTVFRLASVSKALSATVVAGIVGRTKLEWSDPVVSHLPGFRLSDRYVSRTVTLADMFSHRSGLPDHAGDLLEDLGYDRAYVLRKLALEPLGPFRTQWVYTNFGLTAAAVAAARVTGRGWADISDQLLFKPLNMSNSSFRHADFERRSNRAAMHVRVDGKWLQKYDRDADPEAPAGGASSNVLDMARWMRLLLAEGRWEGRALIDRDALLEGHTPQILSGHPSTAESRAGFYGFGTNVGYDYSGRLRLTHSGAFAEGVATQFALLPSEDLGIVVLTNGMPIGVPEASTSYFLDLVVAGSIQEDWLKLYGQKLAGLYVNHSVLAGKRPPAHPQPAQPSAFYAGTYNNDFYGPIKIVATSSGLQLLIGPHPDNYPLAHWDGNRFSFFPTGENAVGITQATFTPNAAGTRAQRVTLEYYNAEGLGTFTRP